MHGLDNKFKNILIIDFENIPGKQIFEIGAVLNNKEFRASKISDIKKVFLKLEEFSKGADYVLGHNIINHDLLLAENIFPEAGFLKLPVIDTLYLSPLAFPENPYHRLIKDYKIVRTGKSDPVKDALLSHSIFIDQINAFVLQKKLNPGLLSFYAFAFKDSIVRGGSNYFKGIFDLFFSLEPEFIDENKAVEIFKKISMGKICINGFEKIIENFFYNKIKKPILSYVLSWIIVSGKNSVLPPWVKHEFKEIGEVIRSLRFYCGDKNCIYCKNHNNSKKILKTYFGYDNFRVLPDKRELQKQIVDANLSGIPVLGILPTGGGKSICYQLPALHRFERLGELTIVISPLKALMKDQVDNLNKNTNTLCSDAINGSLTLPERGEVMERVRLGDTGVLYISPEQLRNESIVSLLESRDIGCFVFDEAHCISKWGHDFRPDYLYVSEFIKKYCRKNKKKPFLCAYTATAKMDVVEEIKTHFSQVLGLDLEVFAGGVERDNLLYSVWPVTPSSKNDLIFNTLNDKLSEYGGAGIVYCLTQKRTERLSDFLNSKGLLSAHFHAGLEEPDKRQIQDDFVEGKIPVICATNAFGMGIDKKDVRIVIHADMPGSLENYLQEAGRAGRDLKESECILLYEEDACHKQFMLNNLSRITIKEMKKILSALRKKSQKTPEIIITPGEINRLILEGEGGGKKEITAVSWLERKGFIERDLNKTIVFQGSPIVKDEEEALKIIEKLNLSQKMKAVYLRILSVLFNQEQKGLVSADDLIIKLGEIARNDERFEDSKYIISIISDMANASIIKKGLVMTAHVRPYGPNSSGKKLQSFASAEKKLLKIMEEMEPLAYENQDNGNLFNLRLMSQKLKSEGFEDITTHGVNIILQSISRDMGSTKRKSITIRGGGGTGQVKIILNSPWEEIKKLVSLRQNLSKIILDKIMEFIPKESEGAKSQVVSDFYLEDIHECIKSDLYYNNCNIEFKPKPDSAAVMCLNYLDRTGAVAVKSGAGVIRQAMTLRVLPECKGRRYNQGDYEPLSHYYGQKNVQVHVMEKYAKIGLDKIRNAILFMSEYFFLPHKSFINKYFREEKDLIETAMNSDDYRLIVESLSNNIQESIVCAKTDENMLVLAGPGSGKTKTIVHRCAWLIKHECIPSNAVLVLCFNHHTMMDLKKRIKKLSGAHYLSVMTFHGFAMRICGNCLEDKNLLESYDSSFFKNIIIEAAEILKGNKNIFGLDAKDSRNLFLSKFRYIFVDEYQDIDETQYELISAITGRLEEDIDEKITIMAVGDDDQNIYSFRNSNIKFIKQFEKDYNASKYYLVENYRSSFPIIESSNFLISFNKNRMKINTPIVINKKRGSQVLNPDETDITSKVCHVLSDDYESMATSVCEEIQRICIENKNLTYDDFAVVSRLGISKPSLVSARMALAAEKIPFCYLLTKECGFNISRVREFQIFFDYLERNCEKSIKPSLVINEALKLYENKNIWTDQVFDLLDIWEKINGDLAVSVCELKNFFIQAFLEEKRDPKTGNGVFLGTVHSVKGMEFEYVFILDGGWDRGKTSESEEETRLFYVGMTRAKKGLFLYSLVNQQNPHTKRLLDFPYVYEKRAKNLKIKGYKPNIKVSLIGMKELFISYPGFFEKNNPIHSSLEKINPKDTVYLRSGKNDEIFIYDKHGNKIARLSKSGTLKWKNALSNIVSARVLAIVSRKKDDDEIADRKNNILVDQWELPIIEVLHE
ncbi:MAG: RecQ family ATP-dependent DNA helicase [Desulfobacteraceae bacterium]|nr:RecQ family ATP-dependent DNA helicase [Desulfobacteraceae bacterium]